MTVSIGDPHLFEECHKDGNFDLHATGYSSSRIDRRFTSTDVMSALSAAVARVRPSPFLPISWQIAIGSMVFAKVLRQ